MPGLFYSESFSGLPYELDLVFPKGVCREDEYHFSEQHYRYPLESSRPAPKLTVILPYNYAQRSGKSCGGPQKTMRLIVLLHEASHFVHDLTLGACLVRDSVLDRAEVMIDLAVELNFMNN